MSPISVHGVETCGRLRDFPADRLSTGGSIVGRVTDVVTQKPIQAVAIRMLRKGISIALDLLRGEVAVPVNEPRSAGTYVVRFDAGRLASGIVGPSFTILTP